MRGMDDLYLDSPMPELLREVTGVEPDRSRKHAMLRAAGVRSTQRLALGEVAGGVVAFTWPAELIDQAEYLYDGARAPRLLTAAREGSWEVDVRPHLAFWRSTPPERLYMNPDPTMTAEKYVERWAGADGKKIGGHDPDTIRGDLWPWLLERGYATKSDTELLEPFLARVAKRKRDVHLRPGLCITRRWNHRDVAELRSRGQLANEIRSAVNRLLAAVGDPSLPMR
jgi:hypothetical protein